MMNRRVFATRLAAAIALVPLMGSVACSWGTVWSDIKKYAPVGLSAVASVVSILTGAGVLGIGLNAAISVILGLINKGFGDVQAAVNQYQAAPGTGLAAQISGILTVLEANIQQFWSDLTIPDPQLASLIQGLLGVITSTIAGFLTQLPAPTTPAAAQARTMRANLQRTIPYVPQKRSVAQFKSAFNSLLTNTQYKQHMI
jgi:hypothetical protein